MISALINKLSIKQKILVLCIAMMMPAFALLTLYVKTENEKISVAKLEEEGADFIKELFPVYHGILAHRGAYNSFFLGDASFQSKITASENEVSEALDAVKTYAQKHTVLDFTAAVKDVDEEWKKLLQENARLTKAESFNRHNKLVEELTGIISSMTEKSGLALDPEASTYYLIDTVTSDIPDLIDHLGRVRALAFESAKTGQVSENTKILLFSSKHDVSDLKESMHHAFENVFEADSRLKTDFQGLLQQLEGDIDRIYALAQEVLESNGAPLSFTAEEAFSRGSSAVDQAEKLAEASLTKLHVLLEDRIAHEAMNRNISLALSFGLFLLVGIFAVLVQRRIQQGLDILTKGFSYIANSEFDQALPVISKDEIGQSIGALNQVMQVLSTNVSEIAEKNKVTARFVQAINVCDTPVMMADKDFNVIFMNENVRKMLEKREKQIQSVLPVFRLDKLMGASIDQFHKAPSHQRNLIGGLKGSHKTELKLAGLTFGLIATPLYSESNEFLGTVVEWLDRTESLAQQDKERAIAEENARVKQALDTVTSNVMIADISYNINYMNHSLKKMMSDAESDLRRVLTSFDAKTLVGRNMDVFHRNPQHQRSMLDNLKSTHRTEISVAGRTFALVATPVADESGKRIGTVVEWADRTQEVMIEKEINDLVSNASAGDLTSRISERGKEGFNLRLSQGLNQLVGVMEKVIEDTTRVLSALAHGSLTEHIDASYQGAFQKLKNDANMTVEKLTEIISNIRQISREVSSGAQEIAQGNADLSQRTEEQASSLEETASSMEEMTATVKQTADNAQAAKTLAVVAKETAQHGGNVVSEAVSAMSGINESSKKIADIIGVIDEIAFQTNLLALNAAVEAARAGDQGRGFAVVAGEVRNLAQRSAAAAKEIKELIRDSVNKVQNGSDLVNKSGSTLQEIVRSVEKVAGTIAEISNAAQEQRSGIEQVNTAVTQMDTMTQQNSALVEEASAASEAMAGQARKLLEMVSFFTLSNMGDERSVGDSSRRASPGKSQKRTASAGKVMRPGEGKEEWNEF